MTIAPAILAALLLLAPHARVRAFAGWEETPAAYESRLKSIAEDIDAAADGQVERAVKLIGVALHESAFAADVDAGRCAHTERGRCDGGKAVSIFQLQERDLERRELYRRNRREAAREALKRIERSERRCAANAPLERLAAYASGGVCELLTVRAVARELGRSVERARRAMR